MTDCTNTMNKIQESYGSTACGVCTNNGLSLKSNHNSHLNNQFSFLIYPQNDFIYRSNDFSYRSNDFIYRSNDFSYRSNDFIYRLKDFSYRSNDFIYRLKDLSYRSNDFIYSLKNDINCIALDNRCYVEKLGKQVKDLLKCFNIKTTYLSNYETITVVGK